MKLVIVDDHQLVRKGLISMFTKGNNVESIQEASNISETLSIIMRDAPDVVLVDLRLGKEDGLDVVIKGKKMSPNTRFIILSTFISQQDFFRAEQIGIDGYILKDAFSEDIFYAVSAVCRGKRYYDSSVVSYKEAGSKNKIMDQLTEREKEVLKELSKGYSNDEIAKELYISENTVKKHVSSILSKLKISHRTQAIVLFSNKVNSL
jgi:two-component system nitrate/nitrite response regulator NarL